MHRSLLMFVAGLIGLCVAPNSSAAVSPYYVRYKLFELPLFADAIVAGEIRSVSDDTFQLRARKVFQGEVPETIEVQRFKNWTCASRWAKYRPGQRVLIFLHAPRKPGKPFGILGGGGEGEMPLLDDDVILREYSVRGHALEDHEIDGGNVSGTRVRLTRFASEMARLRNAIEIHSKMSDTGMSEIELRSKLSPKRLEELADSSPMLRHLVDQAASSRYWFDAEPEAPPQRIAARAISPKRVQTRAGAVDRFRQTKGFGRACAFVGDVDGDGHQDLAAGTLADGQNGNVHGAVWILFLDESGSVKRVTEISEAAGGFPARLNEFAGLGTSVAPLGDLDEDGVPDIVVGAPGWSANGKYVGGVWVLYLRNDGTVRTAVELGGQQALRESGVEPNTHLGEALANLGDLDGDGVPELAIGDDWSPFFTSRGAASTSPSVRIAFLRRDGSVRKVTRLAANASPFKLDRYSWFGRSIAALGDLNGDRIPDVAIGDPGDDDGGDGRGAVWVVLLKADGTPKQATKLSDWSGGFDGRLRDDVNFGDCLASPGDIGNDSFPDLIVGSEDGYWLCELERSGRAKRATLSATSAMFEPENSLGAGVACLPPTPGNHAKRVILGGYAPAHDESELGEGQFWLLRILDSREFASW